MGSLWGDSLPDLPRVRPMGQEWAEIYWISGQIVSIVAVLCQNPELKNYVKNL